MHCPDDARDGMIAYLNNNEVRKPRNTSPDDHFNRIGDTVLLRQKNPSKLQERATGPFPISQVYANGTVDVMRTPDVVERVNVRRLIPYKQPTV